MLCKLAGYASSLAGIDQYAVGGPLGVELPCLAAFSIYPLAMLAGAISMLPGGVGSTEVAIAVQLSWHGVAASTALLAAVVMQFGTTWFSILLEHLVILNQVLLFARKVAA